MRLRETGSAGVRARRSAADGSAVGGPPRLRHLRGADAGARARRVRPAALPHDRPVRLRRAGLVVQTLRAHAAHGSTPLRAIGFGAVFTPEQYRGRGYASVMMAAELDRSRSEGCDLAYLFSDIRPQFYTPFGFRELPSRRTDTRADTLPSQRIAAGQLHDDDWKGVRRCFEACESERGGAFTRGAPVWGWIECARAAGSEHVTGRAFNLVLRRPRGGIRAYVLGRSGTGARCLHARRVRFCRRRVCPADPGAAARRGRRSAAHHRLGSAADACARHAAQRVTSSKRTSAILMMAPLTPEGRHAVAGILAAKGGDFSWGTDHI